MKLPRFALRDLLWLTLVIAMGCGWWASDGCAQSRKPTLIHYVLPVDYAGPFKIVADGQDDGGYTWDGERHVYLIPPSGVLHVASGQPFFQWHRTSGEFSDGAPINTLHVGSGSSIHLAGFGTTSEREMWHAVGTLAELDAIRGVWQQGRSRAFEKILLDKSIDKPRTNSP